MTIAVDALADIGAGLPPIGLDRITAVADLQTRTDRKYLLPVDDWVFVVDQFHRRLHALEIDSRRLFDYESVYFDTPDLLAYHRHAHGRRTRFKIRTRSYLDTGDTALELKTKGGRGETQKQRYPYRMQDRYRLTSDARAVIAEHVADQLAGGTPELALSTCYRRATLLDAASGSRLTCDVGLRFSDGKGHYYDAPPELILVESKTTGRTTPVETALWRRGHRPVSISKYCAGLALLNPELPANRWHRTLRRHFGWEPAHRQYQPSSIPRQGRFSQSINTGAKKITAGNATRPLDNR